MSVKNAKEIFYNDVPDAVAIQAANRLKDEARSTAFTPCGAPAWADPYYSGRRAYARSTLDNAIPVAAQDAMLQASGVRWDIQTFATGHASFLSQPRQLVFTASKDFGYPLDPLATKRTDHYRSLSLGTMLKYAVVPEVIEIDTSDD
ncbi:MAG: hypothetical protein LQ349_008077 [Xanthoria aureola]|nr:MAG: hypothetical protein LQ349_008077 [Xanthoria aureola]